MRSFSTLLSLCVLAVATPAFAQPIPGQLFLNFTDCPASARNKNLDCTSTISTTVLIASANSAVDLNGVIADLGYIDVVVGTDPSSLPPFWQFQTGGCAGSGRIIFSADFTANNICTDIWAGLGSTGGQWGGVTGPIPDGNRARVKWTTNVVPDLNFPIPAGQESYIEKITLRQAPAATCPGCNAPACAVYLGEGLYMISGGSVEILGGTTGTEWLSFNDSSIIEMGCPPLVDPTLKSTWGQVKSLYR